MTEYPTNPNHKTENVVSTFLGIRRVISGLRGHKVSEL